MFTPCVFTGIDVESGAHISLRELRIDVGDDAICISSGVNGEV